MVYAMLEPRSQNGGRMHRHRQLLRHAIMIVVVFWVATWASSALLDGVDRVRLVRSEEHTSELQSLMRISYAVFCLIKKNSYTYHTLIYLYITKQMIISFITYHKYTILNTILHIHNPNYN